MFLSLEYLSVNFYDRIPCGIIRRYTPNSFRFKKKLLDCTNLLLAHYEKITFKTTCNIGVFLWNNSKLYLLNFLVRFFKITSSLRKNIVHFKKVTIQTGFPVSSKITNFTGERFQRSMGDFMTKKMAHVLEFFSTVRTTMKT